MANLMHLEAKVRSLELLCSEALNRAINAEIEIRAMKESTHQVQFVSPESLVSRADGTEYIPNDTKGEFRVSSEKEMNKSFTESVDSMPLPDELNWDLDS